MPRRLPAGAEGDAAQDRSRAPQPATRPLCSQISGPVASDGSQPASGVLAPEQLGEPTARPQIFGLCYPSKVLLHTRAEQTGAPKISLVRKPGFWPVSPELCWSP